MSAPLGLASLPVSSVPMSGRGNQASYVCSLRPNLTPSPKSDIYIKILYTSTINRDFPVTSATETVTSATGKPILSWHALVDLPLEVGDVLYLSTATMAFLLSI